MGADKFLYYRERRRLALSIKQLEADPLLETLDTLMPVQTQVSDFRNCWGIRAFVERCFYGISSMHMSIGIFTMRLTNWRGCCRLHIFNVNLAGFIGANWARRWALRNIFARPGANLWGIDEWRRVFSILTFDKRCLWWPMWSYLEK